MEQKLYTLVDTTSMLRVTTLSAEERELAGNASRLMGLRKSEFYRRAIIEKAQSVLSSVNNETQEASSVREQPRVGGASFLSGKDENGREWK